MTDPIAEMMRIAADLADMSAKAVEMAERMAESDIRLTDERERCTSKAFFTIGDDPFADHSEVPLENMVKIEEVEQNVLPFKALRHRSWWGF